MFGFLGVALGAFGAHGLRKILLETGRVENWETAVFYHLVHAVVLLVLAVRPTVHKATFWSFAAGIIIFSGSLYILALTNLKWLGAITPLGGVGLLVGWLLLVIRRD